jgi:23S rRNA (guanosine2251-2'-O)-methyltransferase
MPAKSNTDHLFIFGRKPIEELLELQPKIIRKLFVLDSVKNATFERIRELSRSTKIVLNSISEQQMSGMVGKEANHQGVIAEMHRFPYADFETWLGELDLSKNPAVMVFSYLNIARRR